MKKVRLILTSAIMAASMSMTALAGQWKSDSNGWWYQNDDGSYPVNQWKEIDGKEYYFGEDGYMLANTTTPDGYQVDENGMLKNSSYHIGRYDNIADDKLQFDYMGELVEVPCKIYYNDRRNGTYTTVRYDSIKVQEWNGRFSNLVIDYTVEKTGGYKNTYFGGELYVNGSKISDLGGADGNEKIYFNKNVTYLIIPTESIEPGDFVEIHINK